MILEIEIENIMKVIAKISLPSRTRKHNIYAISHFHYLSLGIFL